MVVCDVTSENKEVIKQLEDAHVPVQHRSRTKKDSSDEVLRQQMRKVVDTSAQPGRIVLISGLNCFTYSPPNVNIEDCNFACSSRRQ